MKSKLKVWVRKQKQTLKTKGKDWERETRVPKSTLEVQIQNIFLGYGRGKELQKTSVIVACNL